MSKKFLKRIALLIAVCTLFILSIAYWMLPEKIIQPYRYRLEAHPEFRVNALRDALHDFPDSSFFISMPDGTKISATLFQLDQPKSTIVMLCGIGACKEMNMPIALDFLKSGHQCLLLDVRAQGMSEGTYMTYGYFEKYDVKECVNFLHRRFPNLPVGVLGFSLGGAIALQSMDTDERIEFGCILSTFDAMETVVNLYASRAVKGIPLRPITDLALAGAERIAQFETDSVWPSRSSSRITRPVLFVHGDQDRHIPWKYGYANYLACPSPFKQWLLIRDADHNNLMARGGEALTQALIQFADRHTQ